MISGIRWIWTLRSSDCAPKYFIKLWSPVIFSEIPLPRSTTCHNFHFPGNFKFDLRFFFHGRIQVAKPSFKTPSAFKWVRKWKTCSHNSYYENFARWMLQYYLKPKPTSKPRTKNTIKLIIYIQYIAPFFSPNFIHLSSRYCSETNNESSGLLVEVWTKGMIWDRALGYHLIPLNSIPYSKETEGKWYQLDTDVILMDGEVAGTENPTGHMILLDCRFEPPFGR